MSRLAFGQTGSPFLAPVVLDQGGVRYFDSVSRDAILIALFAMRVLDARQDDAKSLSFVAQVSTVQPGAVSARDTAMALVSQGYTVLVQQQFQPFMSQTIKATKDVSQLRSLTDPAKGSYAVLLAPGMGAGMSLPTPGEVGKASPATDAIVQAQARAARLKTVLVAAGAAFAAVILFQQFGKKRVF